MLDQTTYLSILFGPDSVSAITFSNFENQLQKKFFYLVSSDEIPFVMMEVSTQKKGVVPLVHIYMPSLDIYALRMFDTYKGERKIEWHYFESTQNYSGLFPKNYFKHKGLYVYEAV